MLLLPSPLVYVVLVLHAMSLWFNVLLCYTPTSSCILPVHLPPSVLPFSFFLQRYLLRSPSPYRPCLTCIVLYFHSSVSIHYSPDNSPCTPSQTSLPSTFSVGHSCLLSLHYFHHQMSLHLPPCICIIIIIHNMYSLFLFLHFARAEFAFWFPFLSTYSSFCCHAMPFWQACRDRDRARDRGDKAWAGEQG